MMPSPRTLASFDVGDSGAGATEGELAASAAALPPGWKRVLDPASGKHYYYRKDTREVRWQPPIPMAALALDGRHGDAAHGAAQAVELRRSTSTAAVAGAATDAGSSPVLASAAPDESGVVNAARPKRVSVTVASRRSSLSSEGRPVSPPPPPIEVVAAAVAAAEEEEAAMERAVAAAGAAEAAVRRAARKAARGSASPAVRRSSADKRKARGSEGSTGGSGSNALGQATLLDAPAPRHRPRNFAVSMATGVGAGFPEVRILDLRGLASAGAAADEPLQAAELGAGAHLQQAHEALPITEANLDDSEDADACAHSFDEVLAAATAAAASEALPAGGDITPVRVSASPSPSPSPKGSPLSAGLPTPTPPPRQNPLSAAAVTASASAGIVVSPGSGDLAAAELEPLPRPVPQLALPASASEAPGQAAGSARTVVTLGGTEDTDSGTDTAGDDHRQRSDLTAAPATYNAAPAAEKREKETARSSARTAVEHGPPIAGGPFTAAGDAAAAGMHVHAAPSMAEALGGETGFSSTGSDAPIVPQPFTPLAVLPAAAQRLGLGAYAFGSESLVSVLQPAAAAELPQYQSNLQPSPVSAAGVSPRTPPAVHVPAMPSAIKRPNLRLVLQQHAIEATAHRAAERARSAARLAVSMPAGAADSGSTGSVVRNVTPSRLDASSAGSVAPIAGFLPVDLPGGALSPSSASLQLSGQLWKQSRSGLRKGAWQPRFWATHRWLLLYYGSDSDAPDAPLGLFDLRALTDLRTGEEVLAHRMGMGAAAAHTVAADAAVASEASSIRSRSGSLSQHSARSSAGSSSAAAGAPTAAGASGKRSSLWRAWLGLGAGTAVTSAEEAHASEVRAALKELGIALLAPSHDSARDADVSATGAAQGGLIADADSANELACLLELEGDAPMGSVLLKAASPADAARWHAGIIAICKRYGCAAAAGSCLRDAVGGEAPRRSTSTAAPRDGSGPSTAATHTLSASAVFSDSATSSSGSASTGSSRRSSGSRGSAAVDSASDKRLAAAAAAHDQTTSSAAAPTAAAPAAATSGRQVRDARLRQRPRHRPGLPFPIAAPAPAGAAARRNVTAARTGRRRRAAEAGGRGAAAEAPAAAAASAAGWSLSGIVDGLRALGFVQAGSHDGSSRERRASENAQRLPQGRTASASSTSSASSASSVPPSSHKSSSSPRPGSAERAPAPVAAGAQADITPVRPSAASAPSAQPSEVKARADITPPQPASAGQLLPSSGGSSARGSVASHDRDVNSAGQRSARSSQGQQPASTMPSGPQATDSRRVSNAMRDLQLQTPASRHGEPVAADGSSAAVLPGPQSLARLSARRIDATASVTKMIATAPQDDVAAAVTPLAPWPASDALPTMLVASALHSGLSSLAVSPATPMTAGATPHTATAAVTPMTMGDMAGVTPQAALSYSGRTSLVAGDTTGILAAAPGIAFALSGHGALSAPPSAPPSAPSSARASPSASACGDASAATSGQLLPPRHQSVSGSSSPLIMMQLHGEQAKADALERGKRLAALLAERREDARARGQPQIHPGRRDSAASMASANLSGTEAAHDAAAEQPVDLMQAAAAQKSRAQFLSSAASEASLSGTATPPAAEAVVTVDLAAYLPLLMSTVGSAAASVAPSPEAPHAAGVDAGAEAEKSSLSAAISVFPPARGMLLFAHAEASADEKAAAEDATPSLLEVVAVPAADAAVSVSAAVSSVPPLSLPLEREQLLRAPQPSPAGPVSADGSRDSGRDTARLQGVQIELVPSAAQQVLLVPRPPSVRSPQAKPKPQPLSVDDVETVIDAVSLLASLQQAPSPRAGVVAMVAAGGQVPSFASAATAPLVLPPTGNGIMRLRAGLGGRAAALQRRCAALMTEQSGRQQAVAASLSARRSGRTLSAAGGDKLPLAADAHAQALGARLVLHLRAQPEAAARLGASLLRSDDVARWARFAVVSVAGLPFAPPTVFLRMLAAATEQARSLAAAAVASSAASERSAAETKHATGSLRGLPLHALTGPAGTAASLLHELEAALPLWLSFGPCHFAPSAQAASSALVSPGRALLAPALGPLQMAASEPSTRLLSASTDASSSTLADPEVQRSAAFEAVSTFILSSLLSPDALSVVPWPAAAAIYVLYTDAGPDEAVAALAIGLLPPPFAAACAVAAANSISPGSVPGRESAAARHKAAAAAAADVFAAAAWPTPPASGVMSPGEHASIRALLAAGAAAVSLLGLRVGSALLPPDSFASELFHPDHDDWLISQLQDACAASAARLLASGQSPTADAGGLESQARAIADRLAADLTGGTSAAICPPRELACRSVVSAGDLAAAARACVGAVAQAEGASDDSTAAEPLPWLRSLATALDSAGWTAWLPQAALPSAGAASSAADAFACIELRLDGGQHEQATTADTSFDAAAQQLLELPLQLPAARLDSLRSSLVRLQAFAAETGVSSTPRAGAGAGSGSFISVAADTSARLRSLPSALRSELIRCAYEVTASSQDMSAALVEEELLADGSALVEAAAAHLRAQEQGSPSTDAFAYCGAGAAPGRLHALIKLVASSDAAVEVLPVGASVPTRPRSRSRSSSSTASATDATVGGAQTATDLDADAPLLQPPPPPRSQAAANPLRTIPAAAAATAGTSIGPQVALSASSSDSADASAAAESTAASVETGVNSATVPSPSPLHREPSSRRSVARGRGLPASATGVQADGAGAAPAAPVAGESGQAGEIYTRTLAVLSGHSGAAQPAEASMPVPLMAAATVEPQIAATAAVAHTAAVLPPMRDFLHGFEALRPAMPAPSTARTGATAASGGAAASARSGGVIGGGGGTTRQSDRRDSVQSSGGASMVSVSSVASAAVLSPAPVASLAGALAALAAARSPRQVKGTPPCIDERFAATCGANDAGIPTAVVSLADLAAAFAAEGDGDEEDDSDDVGGGMYARESGGSVQQPTQEVHSRRSVSKRGHHSLASAAQPAAAFPWAGLGTFAHGSNAGASNARSALLQQSVAGVPTAAAATPAEPLHAKAAVVREGDSLELPRLQPETDSDARSSGSRGAALRLQPASGYGYHPAAGTTGLASSGSYSSRSLSPRLGPRSASPRAVGPRTLLGSPTLLSYGVRTSPAMRQPGTPAGPVPARSASASSLALSSPPPALPVLSASLFSPSFPPARVGVAATGGAFVLGLSSPTGCATGDAGTASVQDALLASHDVNAVSAATVSSSLVDISQSMTSRPKLDAATATALSATVTEKPAVPLTGPAIPRLAVEALVGRDKAPAIVAAAALSPAPRPRPQTVSLLHYASSPARVPQLQTPTRDAGTAAASGRSTSTVPGHSVRFASQPQGQQPGAGASTGRSLSVDSPQLRSALRHASTSSPASTSSLSTSAGTSTLRAGAGTATGTVPEPSAAVASSPSKSRYASLGALLQSLV